ncbi:MAG: hypothetical protein R3B93_29340 [Bacteroidia bacterium]
MIYIIGSGPSAIAALIACLNQQKEVTLLDLGFTPDSPFQHHAQRPYNKNNYPQKTTHGSDYPYWSPPNFSYLVKNPEGILSSFARGGFSAVWGAGILPYLPQEFTNWPINFQDLQPYYQKLHTFLPITGQPDLLEEDFSLFSQNPYPINPSSQFEKVFQSVHQYQNKLTEKGIFVGKSRLSIQQHPQPCTYCGQCIKGCPDQLIYSSSHTLEQALTSPLVTYLPGRKVEKFQSVSDGIEIEAFNLQTNQPEKFQAEKVFLGAGVLSSTQIMMRSLNAYGKTLSIKDSQYFLFPMLGPYASGIMNEKSFTLSQAFLEIMNPEIYSQRIHLSLYGFSPFLKDYVYRKFGVFSQLVKPFLNYGIKRTFIAQGFLPSSESNEIHISLSKSEKDEFLITPNHSQKVQKKILNLVKKLNQFRRETRLFGLSPLLNIAPIGKSFHLGGSFPMRKKPQSEFETGALGESPALPNVHLIGPAYFHDIASGPITYTMMANAYRITATLKK